MKDIKIEQIRNCIQQVKHFPSNKRKRKYKEGFVYVIGEMQEHQVDMHFEGKDDRNIPKEKAIKIINESIKIEKECKNKESTKALYALLKKVKNL